MLQLEPDPLDGIHMRTILGQLARLQAWIGCAPVGHRPGCASTEIIHEDHDGALWLGRQQILQEGKEGFGAHPLADRINPPPRVDIRGPEQRPCDFRAGDGDPRLLPALLPHGANQGEQLQLGLLLCRLFGIDYHASPP